MTELTWASAGAIASSVARGEINATQVIEQTLARIARRDTVLNAFTAVTAERAHTRAAAKPAGLTWARSRATPPIWRSLTMR